uniref:Thymidylate synthase n=1 Tax=viral metagenome TaxID=1070528 RepID=A0A6C0LR09_9ZZZZ
METKRPTVLELEKLFDDPIKILDHGFILVSDYMGNDNSVVQAARVSYGRDMEKKDGKGLINYLMKHKHTSPFEMCEIKFCIQAPIFVVRQWFRHRTANINEYSARYSILSKEFYLPSIENINAQSKMNHQGRGEKLAENECNKILDILREDSLKCYDYYEKMLNYDDKGEKINSEFDGVARELARIGLTLNYYTRFYWKIDCHNLMHFLELRCDSHAQFEIREYANAMLNIFKIWMPLSYDAFVNYRKNAITLSEKQLELIKNITNGKTIDYNKLLNRREFDELIDIFGLKT